MVLTYVNMENVVGDCARRENPAVRDSLFFHREEFSIFMHKNKKPSCKGRGA